MYRTETTSPSDCSEQVIDYTWQRTCQGVRVVPVSETVSAARKRKPESVWENSNVSLWEVFLGREARSIAPILLSARWNYFYTDTLQKADQQGGVLIDCDLFIRVLALVGNTDKTNF